MFTQKKLKIAFNIFLLIVGIFATVQLPLVGLPVLGGVITQGILGGFSGKVGPVVGGKWKDIDYMRSYVIPANPNTTAQQAVRAKFSALVAYAQGLLPTLLQVYWDPFYSKMSGFNAFISENYENIGISNTIETNAVFSKGTLEGFPSITSAVIAGTTLTVTFDGSTSGNGLGTDLIKGVLYHALTDTLTFISSTKTRAESPITLTVPAGTTDDDMIWLFLHRGTGSEFVVSDSLVAIVES